MRVCEGSLKTAARVEQRSGCWAVCGGGQCVGRAALVGNVVLACVRIGRTACI